ncbi:helix-hairpin-helix domain-containing protein [Angustibacter aerolatus]
MHRDDVFDTDPGSHRRGPAGSRPLLDPAAVVPRRRWHDALQLTAARTGVSPRTVLGLLVVAAVVLSVLGVRVALDRRAARPVPLAPVVQVTAAPAGSTGTSGSGGGPAATDTGAVSTAGPPTPTVPPSPGGGGAAAASATGGPVVVVDVVGRVRHPGVQRLPAGARVEQAIEAAGGVRGGADVAQVNLARPLVDGEQVVVPSRGETLTAPAAAPAAGGSPTGPTQPIDLNQAGATELDTLPGVGPVLAQRILDWRGEHGRFSSVDELGEVSGIGDAVLGRLRPLVRV